MSVNLPLLGEAEISGTDLAVMVLGLISIAYYLLTFDLGLLHLIVNSIGVLVSLVLILIYLDRARWKAQHAHRRG